MYRAIRAMLVCRGMWGRRVHRDLMGHAELTVVTPALRIVGNFISGSDTQTSAAIAAGALPALVPLLAHPRRTL